MYSVEIKKRQVGHLEGLCKSAYHRDGRMSSPEVMTILIMFHNSGYKHLKSFYLNEICINSRDLFPKVVSYNRFVELQKEAMLPLCALLKSKLLGKCTGISFADSTPLGVCREQRIRQHKVFKDLAEIGHYSMGMFYGFKPHLICNEKGDLLNFTFTPGNVDDRKPLENKRFVEVLSGKLFADRGYVSKSLYESIQFEKSGEEAVKGNEIHEGMILKSDEKNSVIVRLTMDELVRELKDKYSYELSSTLFGGRLPE